jgi:hypothetical protein
MRKRFVLFAGLLALVVVGGYVLLWLNGAARLPTIRVCR